MRVTQSLMQFQFLAALNTQEAAHSQTLNQISSNLAFTTPSQNPVAAGAVNHYNQTLSQSKQYDINANSAQSRLGTEENALSQVQTALQSLRTLALQANNGSLSTQDRAAIGVQATQIQATLVSLANTQDGNGEYLFGGFATQSPPFTATATGATYNGDTGQRQVQIAAGQSIPDGDNGSALFDQVNKTGNGTFSVTPAAGNTGTGLLGATTVVSAAAYDGKPFSIQFVIPALPPGGTVASTYDVIDSTGTKVASASGLPYVAGQPISYDGVQVTLTGQPAAGDTFNVAPSIPQSLFASVQNLVTALNTAATSTITNANLGIAVDTALTNIDQALTQTSNIRSSIGGRLNSITTQLSVSSSQQIQLQSSISSLQSLDYASAVTTLTAQGVTLSVSMQAYTMTQGLSLFKYISG